MTADPRARVLVVAGWYPAPDDAVDGVFVADHARAAALHHDVTVLVLERGPVRGPRLAQVRRSVEHGLPTLRLRVDERVPAALGGLVYVPRALALLAGARRRGQGPAVIHAHVFAAGLLGVILGAAARVPVVVSEHFSAVQLGTLTRAERRIARIAYGRATIVCPVSAALRDAIRPLAPAARFEIVPNIVDTAVFTPGDAPSVRREPQLLFVGLLDEVKDVAGLLRAFATVREHHPGARLDVVGDGPRRAAYEALTAELGLDDAVRFHGRLPRTAIAPLMRAADALLLPSVTETFGIVVIEALACGLPVVATRVGALPELVDADAGVLVDPGDPQALAAGIESLLAGLDGYDRAALAARTRARYGVAAVAGRWREVYRQALAAR